ncbi:hypothetical protein JN11_01998 [Mucilaginibacter frigoritolerans]|uniref:Parallel beta helix pectate lyase-like protein n=1 Tax=Mucilaginibacter frigoritolerans TaxID=652788 RepID=A0A562U4J8_9SPHI|nr:hypothetical protein [Mucilaginibacter frigoritolerans]TWJ00742.1 hypothetical protein JN11_01998 [Mucilaginibacter frigoritolerans]
MKKLQIIALGISLLALAACSKKSDNAVVSVPQIQIGKAIPNTGVLPAGSYKGTLLANQTYTVGGDITINAGDTLLIQKGVKINMTNGANFIVNGDLISLGTSSSPVTITDPRRTKVPGTSVLGQDSAYVGGWGGIYAGPTSKLVVLKWTHLDFGGAALKALPFTGANSLKVGAQYILYFTNPNGVFIMEDSWMYGSPDDATRFYGGYYNIMRNTMEKCGSNGGDGFNAKGSAVGNMAYNLIIGGATNGTKTASDGTTAGECQFTMYNNTYVNDGFRNNGVYGARSGSVEIENNSRALVYNNLIVNCDFGVRIAGGPAGAKVYLADTTLVTNGSVLFPQTKYGYNFYYADAASIADQFVPTNVAQQVVTHPQSTDIPNMAAFLGVNYTFGLVYDGSSLVGKNNPMFTNFPLPATAGSWVTQCSVDGYNFRLQSGSPAAGKGTTTAFQPITTGIPLDANFGSSGITPPGQDIGCYQLNGTGNQH